MARLWSALVATCFRLRHPVPEGQTDRSLARSAVPPGRRPVLPDPATNRRATVLCPLPDEEPWFCMCLEPPRGRRSEEVRRDALPT
jgi:hypothetical protein